MTVQASRVIPAKPADVWRALTAREGMKAYMMGADVETDWRVGGPITMRGEFHGKSFEDKGEVRSFEPERRLSYTHISSAAPDQAHLVTFELQPRGAGTEVTVTQASAGQTAAASDEKNRAQYEKTWAMMLEGLEKAVAH
ncbi:MAG TPA: SRPBCC domain-containing protein [Phenylobacterium sp.]|nr:SRPBCC domain-containing protein [Phenylobacterium sp.]